MEQEKMKNNNGKDSTVSHKQPEETSNAMTRPVKPEEDVEVNTSILCSTSYPIAGSKSRQHLTEAEKEARRLRRVLANRESARQTIRRRQSMFEELTRKAVDLELQNEDLKRDKELAAKEYNSLKSTNHCLKAQIADMSKAETEEIQEKSKPSLSESSSSVSTTAPSMISNQASTVPFAWPSIIQPTDGSFQQCRSESGISTIVPVNQMGMPNSFLDQGNSVMVADPGSLLYVLPLSCFFPFHALSNAPHPHSSELNEKQNETSMIQQCDTSDSSKTVVQVADNQSTLPLKDKPEASNSVGSISAHIHQESGSGFPPDGGGQGEGICPKTLVLMQAPVVCVRPIASVGPFTSLHRDNSCNAGAAASASGHTTEGVSEEHQKPEPCPRKKLPDAVAAAEARRRRKELIKLKNLQTKESPG